MIPIHKNIIILWAALLFQAGSIAPIAAADDISSKGQGRDDSSEAHFGFKPMYVYQEPDSEESLEGIENQFKSSQETILSEEEEHNLYGSPDDDC